MTLVVFKQLYLQLYRLILGKFSVRDSNIRNLGLKCRFFHSNTRKLGSKCDLSHLKHPNRTSKDPFHLLFTFPLLKSSPIFVSASPAFFLVAPNFQSREIPSTLEWPYLDDKGRFRAIFTTKITPNGYQDSARSHLRTRFAKKEEIPLIELNER